MSLFINTTFKNLDEINLKCMGTRSKEKPYFSLSFLE